MRQKILTGLVVASLALSQYSLAQEWTTVTSDTLESSVVVDESQDYVSFYADNNLGAPTTLSSTWITGPGQTLLPMVMCLQARFRKE